MKQTDYTGQTIDNKYCLIHLLGEGGMGSVYLGEHRIIGKKVAVKFLNAELASRDDLVKRFFREAQAAAAIAHKNIIEVLDVGVLNENEPYLVMEYLEGESLSAMLARTGPLDLAAACGIMEPALLALAAAHDKGIVHRDLKPDNIFLVHSPDEPPAVKLIDFGISKLTGQSDGSQMTRTGEVLGTPAYMAPEQIRGDKALDHRADLYAIGVILYQMLTGRLPIASEQWATLAVKVLTEPPVPPEEAHPGFPMEAEGLVLRLLSKRADERPESARAVLEELQSLGSYHSRQASLTRFASGISKKTFAGGDLGVRLSSERSGPSASDLLTDLLGKRTPSVWSGTVVPKQRRWALVAGAVAALLVVAAGVIALLPDASEPEVPVSLSASPPTPAPGEPLPQTVRIEVTGAPPDAVVYLDGARALQNPVLVNRSTKTAELKVTAEGHFDYVGGVVPDQDRRIAVTLVPKPEAPVDKKRATSTRSRRARRTKTPAKEPPASKASEPPKTPSEDKVKKLKDKYIYTEDF